jgi:hypothetical protein
MMVGMTMTQQSKSYCGEGRKEEEDSGGGSTKTLGEGHNYVTSQGHGQPRHDRMATAPTQIPRRRLQMRTGGYIPSTTLARPNSRSSGLGATISNPDNGGDENDTAIKKLVRGGKRRGER